MASMGEVQVRVQVEHPLVCLNQHPEHLWEDSGLYLAKANRLGVVTREAGPLVEVCSRPGCGLIRVRQEKKVNEVVEKTYIGQETDLRYFETSDGSAYVAKEEKQAQCERCQCLTPVSELSRDAQGRMVCKHHG